MSSVRWRSVRQFPGNLVMIKWVDFIHGLCLTYQTLLQVTTVLRNVVDGKYYVMPKTRKRGYDEEWQGYTARPFETIGAAIRHARKITKHLDLSELDK